MNTPKLSIIIPTFNSEKTIHNTALSLPSCPDVEIIIIDGDSKDQTLNILKNSKHPNLTILSEPDLGIYDAMNKGIAIAKGAFLYFLGSDDLWVGNVEDIIKTLKDQNTIYYGNIVKHPSGKNYGGYFPHKKLLIRNISHQAIFYPKAVFGNYKYRTELKVCADHYLNLELMYSRQFNFHYIDKLICRFSEQGVSSNTLRDEVFEQARKQIIGRHGSNSDRLLFWVWDHLRRKR